MKIDVELITDITLWTKGHRKNKWVVGRAIVGTVIIGGLGAILGGMTGLKPTDLIEFIITFHAGENKLNISIETVKQNQVEKLASKLYNFIYKSKVYLEIKEESVF